MRSEQIPENFCVSNIPQKNIMHNIRKINLY
jgi:hypothetical protein